MKESSMLFPAATTEERELMVKHYPSKYIVAIGDIHGQLDALKRLFIKLEKKLGSKLYDTYHVVFLGDYVDRGPKIKETIGWMIDLKEKRKPKTTHFLMGNHCHAFAMFLGLWDDDVDPNRSLGTTCKNYTRDFELWSGEGHKDMHLQGRRWGTGFVYSSFNTFYSYCCDDARKDLEVVGKRDLLRKCVPSSHKRFFKEMPWVLYNDDAIFVHGGFHSSTSLKEQLLVLLKKDIYTARVKPLSERSYIDMDGHPETHRMIVSGHTQVKHVKISPKRALVDISGGVGGELACIVLPYAKAISTVEDDEETDLIEE